MQVTRDNLDTELDGIRKAIDECSFFAMDMEFTGLNLRGENPTASDVIDNLQERFHKQSAGARSFLVLQFGLCCVRFDGNRWVAKTWSFYLFPTDLSGATMTLNPPRVHVHLNNSPEPIAATHGRFACGSPRGLAVLGLEQEATRSTARCRQSSSLPRCEALPGLIARDGYRAGLCLSKGGLKVFWAP